MWVIHISIASIPGRRAGRLLHSLHLIQCRGGRRRLWLFHDPFHIQSSHLWTYDTAWLALLYHNHRLPGMSVVRHAPFWKLKGRSCRGVHVSDAMLYSTLPLGFALPPSIRSLVSSTLTKQALIMKKHEQI